MKKKTTQLVNLIVIGIIFVLNYFYQSNGFDFTLKCICSGGFALLGIINLAYACSNEKANTKYYLSMAVGLFLAMLGDVLIGRSFILGAATFALGHVFFVVAYCIDKKPNKLDVSLSVVIFLAALAFLLLCPLLSFEKPIFRIVCVVYALIISSMLGKAFSNLIKERTFSNITIALGSALFFFSDLMLVFDWFIGLWSWTDNACMGTYYPALCLLAFSMLKKTEG